MRIANGFSLVVVVALSLITLPALSAPLGQRNFRDGDGGNARGFSKHELRGQQRAYPQRNAGQEERQQRLSQEERRQLRRDIRDAGREIYRGPRQ